MIFHEMIGPVSALLRTVGLPEPAWISSGPGAFIALVMIVVWKWTPFVCLIVLVAVHNIFKDIYDAASLETRSGFQAFWYVTAPLLVHTLLSSVVLRVIWAFKVNALPHGVTSGGPGRATGAYNILVHKVGITFLKFDKGVAMAYIPLLMVCIAFLFSRSRSIYE